MLNSLSTGADDVSMHKDFGTSLANDGYFSAWDFQKLSGTASSGRHRALQ